ncbi:MAG: toll/interleukin-1 receptor domain-containing protein [Methanosarcinales archaeon]|nr:toll/interleukin-1 receptor domain-containing protein [Methanosarcinales archaeon]
MNHPKSFISYSWEDDQHKDWVRHLPNELQKNGVYTYLDQWDAHPGMDLTRYMETCICDSEFVLLICTPIFAQKANHGHGGVGYEKSIVTGEIFEEIASEKKFVPLLRKGDPKLSIPSYLKSRIFIDFRNDENFAENIEILLRHIHKLPNHARPPIKSPLKSFPSEKTNNQSIDNKINKINKLKKISRFAYKSDGLNMTQGEAIKWAIKSLLKY